MIPPGLSYLADNIISKDNLLGADKKRSARWAKDLNLAKGGETIFFAGCGYQYSGEIEGLLALLRRTEKSSLSPELAIGAAGFSKKLGVDPARVYQKVMVRGSNPGAQPLVDAVKVLGHLGINFGYLGEEEPCCGGPLYYFGLHQQFTRHAQGAHARLNAKGVKQVISIVPSCTYALRNLISSVVPADGLEVKHYCEVVAENLSSLKLRFPREVKVTYHDPCQLVRYLGLIEEPRQILRSISGLELVEPAWTTGEYATCCGGGGGFEAVFPELSQILAVNRVSELVATGAEILVTHCPGCLLQLKSGLKELKTSGVEALDLTQIVAMSL